MGLDYFILVEYFEIRDIFRKFFTSLTISKLFLLLIMGFLFGVGGVYTYSFIKRKISSSTNIKITEKKGPKIIWISEEGEELIDFEGEVVKFEDNVLEVKQKGVTEVIKIKKDALITLKIGTNKMEVVSREEIRVGDKVHLAAIERRDDLWMAGYVKIFRKK